jgi:hypothetical protein
VVRAHHEEELQPLVFHPQLAGVTLQEENIVSDEVIDKGFACVGL